MIVTATTSTIALNALAVGSLSLLVSLSLVALLIQKEIIGSLARPWSRRALRQIDAVLPPLYAICALTVAERIYDVLR